MSLKIRFHELAALEFQAAIDYYENESKGLGNRFQSTVRAQIEKIRQYPTWFLKEDDILYKAFVPKFPFKILYSVDDFEIVIWVVANMHRKPNYWVDRL